MAYSFEEIMAFHPDNSSVYEEIKRNISVLCPFVGAGLTQFAYYSWADALRKLVEKITEKERAEQIRSLIYARDYLKAAQLLEELRSPLNLSHDIVSIFSSKRLEENIDKLRDEAIYLLPLLFQGLVLTTNFDTTLETVYQTHETPFQSVFHPGHYELLLQTIRHPGDNYLFKLHGTITGDLMEYGSIVFTEKQYNRHYGKESPLPQELKQCFVQKPILFLGCSLEQDATMDVLDSILVPGMSHYAILSCQRDDRDRKIRELGRRQIRVIVYEDNRHEAVRVIFERLLQDLHPVQYKPLLSTKKAQREPVASVKHVKSARMEDPSIYYMDRGFCMPWQCAPNRETIFLPNSHILLIYGEKAADGYITDMTRLVIQKDCSLLIIMESYTAAERLGLFFNELMQESRLPVAAILAPGFGDTRRGFMADISTYIGAEIVEKDWLQLGRAESAMVSNTSTILRGGAGSGRAIKAQIDKIRNALNVSTIEHDIERYQERIGRLSGAAEEDDFGKNSAVEWRLYVSETMQELLHSAAQGDAKAKLELGLFYLWCYGIQNDRAQAERWIKDSAKQGNRDAQILLGILYAYGGSNWNINAAEAKKWVRRAIGQRDCQIAKFFLERIEGNI